MRYAVAANPSGDSTRLRLTPSQLFAAFSLLLIIATLAAGAFLVARLLKKVTLKFVQIVVASMMVLVGAGLVAGLL